MTSIKERNELRLVSVIEEAEDHYVQNVMIGYGLGQEEPVWLSVEEDGDPSPRSRLLVLGPSGLSIIDSYLTRKHLGTFDHYLFIPPDPGGN